MTEIPHVAEWPTLPSPSAATAPQDGHGPDTRPSAPPKLTSERRAREDVRARLTRNFPEAPHAALTAATTEAFEYFTSARIRHYVPVLALKRASRQLARRLPEREGGGEHA